MRKRRVLITGGSGLLAINWACAVRENWDVILGTHRHSVELARTTSCMLNLDDPVRLASKFEQLAPDVVVHAAGLTNVDRCQEFPALARQANSEIARNVAQVASWSNATLIHISTDHLFAGDHSLYQEGDIPQPLNEYGRSKLLAEEWVQQACPRALIVRTNFFAWGHVRRQSFSDWIIYNLRAGKPLTLFDDVYFTPILADSLALAAHELAALGESGVVNLVGDERLSKYEFAQRLAGCFKLPAELIRRDQITRANLLARRPRDMSLSNAKARQMLGRRLGSVHDHLAGLYSQELQRRPLELLHSTSD